MTVAEIGDSIIGGQGRALRNVEVSLDAGASRVTLVGEIDMADAEPLQELLAGVVGRLRHVELDMRAVRFIDSAGCQALLQVARRAADVGGRITVVTSHGPVRKVLSLLEIEEILGVEEEDVPPG